MAYWREYFEPPNVAEKRWGTVRQLRKRILFFAWAQSALAILSVVPMYIAVFGYGLDKPEAELLMSLFFALFLLPGFTLAYHIFRLKVMLGKGLDHIDAVYCAIKSIAPGWGIIIALLEAEVAQTDIDRYAPLESDPVEKTHD